jgi:hypothetical protein
MTKDLRKAVEADEGASLKLNAPNDVMYAWA